MKKIKLIVKTKSKKYPIIIGSNIISEMPGILKSNNIFFEKSLIIVDTKVPKKKLNTLKTQLDRFNAIGGTKAIVPSEGIVFKYKGKTYKFTGAFAPVNQITGLISF